MNIKQRTKQFIIKMLNIQLNDVEQYRMQMAGISTASFGYFKRNELIHPDYETPALYDVCSLYEKYDTLYKQYHELVNGVTNKYPDLTRHQTALMYIKRAEFFGIDVR